MLDISRDIDSLSHFKRNTSAFLRQLRETGQPVVLTLNGKAELVVQDVKSYQKLVNLVERLEDLEVTRRSIAETEAGETVPAEEVLAEMRRLLAEKKGR